MKKLILLIATITIISFTLCACGNSNNTNGENNSEAVKQEVISLTKDNIQDYISASVYCDNAKCTNENSITTYHIHTWNTHVDVSSTGSYTFDNVSIDVTVNYKILHYKETFTIKLNGEGQGSITKSSRTMSASKTTYQYVDILEYEITNVSGTVTK